MGLYCKVQLPEFLGLLPFRRGERYAKHPRETKCKTHDSGKHLLSRFAKHSVFPFENKSSKHPRNILETRGVISPNAIEADFKNIDIAEKTYLCVLWNVEVISTTSSLALDAICAIGAWLK